MVLIFSNEDDVTTDKVIQWLIYLKLTFIRINNCDKIILDRLDLANSIVELKIIKLNGVNEVFNINDIKFVWYRRGHLKIFHTGWGNNWESNIKKQIRAHLGNELNEIDDFLEYLIFNKPHINRFKFHRVNKLISLEIAKSVGLNIPETKILKKFDAKLDKLFVTKSISESFVVQTEHGNFATYTADISHVENKIFFYSLIQKKINKEADIRVFYLLGEFYAMAIMSQKSPQTSTDFRLYDYKNPNRKFPFRLPTTIEDKIKNLMSKMTLESGSLDLVLDTSGEYYFLEINPIGQFGMTSYPCNYYLEKRVAEIIFTNLSKL